MLEIFRYTDADLSLDELEEARLILIAQGHPGGDPEAAKTRLLQAYGPALRAAVSRFKGGVFDGQVSPTAADYGTSSRSIEDLQSAALVGFLEAIEEHDPSQGARLAGHLVQRLNRALSDEVVAAPAFAVPTRTVSRFFGILRAADGDVAEAERIASDYSMSPETFRDVLAAVGTESLDGQTLHDDDSTRDVIASPVFTPSPVVDVEDRILVDAAFAAMGDEEARICELYYGFTEYDPVPDAEIAHRLGLSRPAVQRKRTKALGKARTALGVAYSEEV